MYGHTCASTVTELLKPDLGQARVNKCLIALVNRKVVQKDNGTVCLSCLNEIVVSYAYRLFRQGSVLYHWRGLP